MKISGSILQTFLLSYKKIFMVRTFLSFFWFDFFTILRSVKSMQLNYIKKEILST